MGKYMRKCSRGIGEVAVMEVTQVVGARTRARALALAAESAAAAGDEAPQDAGRKRSKVEAVEFHVSYLQLRNRSLILTPGKSKRAPGAASDSSAVLRSSGASKRSSGGDGQCVAARGGEWDRVSRCSSNTSSEVLAAAAATERASSRSVGAGPEVDDGSETTACNYDGNQQRWRERTPSSEARERETDDLESTARPAESGGGRRSGAASQGGAPLMPSEAEIEEFFAAAEKKEWTRFAKKYNYDVVKDVPLEGRYEWVQIKP